MEQFQFRYAEEKDTALILQFIKELAEYEHMLNEVVATEELLTEWMFQKEKAEVIFALEDGKEVGFAVFFHNLSWACRYLFRRFVCKAGVSGQRLWQGTLETTG